MVTPEADAGPLAGLRVIEMGSLLAGPFCGQLLGDFGAEVIKLEPPGTGDPMRQWGREKPHGLSLWWPVVARNKKSVTCNLREPEGQGIARRLIASADFVVENFRPGTMERWNLGYERLAELNPGIIMIRVTGYGQTGPYASRAGFGSIGEAMGGLRYITGDPERPPSRTGISIGDALAGTFAAVGGLAALHMRQESGQGQVVDCAIFEAVLAMMESLVPEYQIAGYTRERTGAILPNVAPSNIYPTSDGRMILIAANRDTVFRRLTELMGRSELADDKRFATHSARGDNQEELDELVASWTRTQPEADLLTLLDDGGVPAGLIFTAADMLEDPHFKARMSLIDVAHPEFGRIAMQNVVPRLSATPGEVRWAGPKLGEHNDEILQGVLGIEPETQRELAEQGII